jgi:hypothetical protein
MTETAITREIARTVERIGPILAGRPPEIQGAILADLLAMWLAGHHCAGDEYLTQQLREGLLAEHCTAVRQLVEINAHILEARPDERR